MRLHDLSPAKGSKQNRTRLGRGVGSGQGKTAGKGSKGQNARSGGGVRPGYEGGQMPIHRRLPKRGFTNIFKKKVHVINIQDLLVYESGNTIDRASLMGAGLVKGRCDGVKLLAKGDISIPLNVKVEYASQQAIQKIEAAGGHIEVTTVEVSP